MVRPSTKEVEEKSLSQLKKTMNKMVSERTQKSLIADAENTRRIERDAIRHERFVSEFETPEQKAQKAREAKLKAINQLIEECSIDEDEARDTLEQEQVLEFKLFMHEHHLEVFGMTVAIVTAENAKKERQLKVIEEQQIRKAISDGHLRKALENEETESRRNVFKQEAQAARQLTIFEKESIRKARDDEQRRIVEEQELLNEMDRLDREEYEAARDEEVRQAEEEVEEQMRRIEDNFQLGIAGRHRVSAYAATPPPRHLQRETSIERRNRRDDEGYEEYPGEPADDGYHLNESELIPKERRRTNPRDTPPAEEDESSLAFIGTQDSVSSNSTKKKKAGVSFTTTQESSGSGFTKSGDGSHSKSSSGPPLRLTEEVLNAYGELGIVEDDAGSDDSDEAFEKQWSQAARRTMK